jgi:hypothetical protein
MCELSSWTIDKANGSSRTMHLYYQGFGKKRCRAGLLRLGRGRACVEIRKWPAIGQCGCDTCEAKKTGEQDFL